MFYNSELHVTFKCGLLFKVEFNYLCILYVYLYILLLLNLYISLNILQFKVSFLYIIYLINLSKFCL